MLEVADDILVGGLHGPSLAQPRRAIASLVMPLVAPWNRKKRAQRERLGHEQPGAVLGGPPITITCECGEKRELKYGEDVDLRELRAALGHKSDSGRAVQGDSEHAAPLPRAARGLRARRCSPSRCSSP